MAAAVLVFSTLFGLAFGSFLNVVVYRLPRRESLSSPPSRCPACGTNLAWRDNIPVLSWVALRGHCRYCGSVISARYPLIELATGMLFLAVAIAFV